MSRSATALAYDLAPAQARPRPASCTPYRLLGEHQLGTLAAARPNRATAGRTKRPPVRHYELVAVSTYEEGYYPPHLHGSHSTRQAKKVAHPQWLLGTLLCVLALVVATPVWANGRAAAKSKRVAISGYNGPTSSKEAASGPSPAIVAAPQSQQPAASLPSKPAPRPAYELLGPPTISVERIESVLADYGSDAVGHGRALHDLGVRYGIDPAYALAFFVHESGCGTRGVARFTHSIGNIRWTPGYDNYQGYRSYSSWEQGMEDWYGLITDLYINGWNLRTVDAIVPVYAPYGDNNNPPIYIAAVKAMVDAWRGK